MQRGPTDLQLKWLTCIDKMIAKLGGPPTLEELADAMKASKSAAQQMVERLQLNGYLKVQRIVKWEITHTAREWM